MASGSSLMCRANLNVNRFCRLLKPVVDPFGKAYNSSSYVEENWKLTIRPEAVGPCIAGDNGQYVRYILLQLPRNEGYSPMNKTNSINLSVKSKNAGFLWWKRVTILSPPASFLKDYTGTIHQIIAKNRILKKISKNSIVYPFFFKIFWKSWIFA